jgi:ATP-dependent DNA ligase
MVRPPGTGNDQEPRAAWTPPPAGLRPMLATPVTELPADDGWSFEPKWDGYLH